MKRNLPSLSTDSESNNIDIQHQQHDEESERKKKKTAPSVFLDDLLERYEKVLQSIKSELSNNNSTIRSGDKHSELRTELDFCHFTLIDVMDHPIIHQPKEDYSSYTEFVEQSINDIVPDHVLSRIFSYLGFLDFREVSRTCMMWRRICFTIQSALSSFEVSGEIPVESAMNLFMRFVEWRVSFIRKVNICSTVMFVNCGYKFSAVKFLDEASMSLSGFPNVERVKQLEISSTFFGDMYKYPGLESIKFVNLKDAVIDFFHCSMFGLTLVESLLPLIDFEKVDSLRLMSNSKLLHSLAVYAKENIQSKANELFQKIDTKVKYLTIFLNEIGQIDEEFDAEVAISLNNLEKLNVQYSSARMMNLLQFNPDKLQLLHIQCWELRHKIENPLQPRDDFELYLVSSFHQLLTRSLKVQSLILGRLVHPLFYRTFEFSQFCNLRYLQLLEIDNSNLTQLAPNLEVLKVATITGFEPEMFNLFTSLRKLEIDTKYASKIDFIVLPKLSKICLQSDSAQYSVNINSNSLRSIKVNSEIRNLTINAIKLEKCLLQRDTEKLSIRSNQLEFLCMMFHYNVRDLSILSFEVPNLGCENVSPLKHLNLSHFNTIRHLHCPYLKAITVKSIATICQLVDLDQTPLIESILFEGAFIEPDAFKTILDYFENLKKIDFYDCNLGSNKTEIIDFSSTIEVIDIYNGTPELIRFLTSLFSEIPTMKGVYLMDSEVDDTFIESISQPKPNQWNNLEVISLQNCKNITGKVISDFYSNIEHYASLRSLTLVLSPGNEIIYDARLPQTLESFTGLFNSVEIIPTQRARGNIVNLKTITLDGKNSTFAHFEINTFLESLFDLFVDDKEEMAPFRSELHSLLAYEALIADTESTPPDFKLINKVVAGIPSIRIVSKHLFTDDPVVLQSQRPNLKMCDY